MMTGASQLWRGSANKKEVLQCNSVSSKARQQRGVSRCGNCKADRKNRKAFLGNMSEIQIRGMSAGAVVVVVFVCARVCTMC